MFGFALGYLPVLYLLANTISTRPPVMAKAEDEHITVVLETIAPEEEERAEVLAAADSLKPESETSPIPEETDTPKPTKSPTSTPEPTESPGPTTSPTVEPTLTPTPIPPAPAATPDVWPPEIYRPWLEQYAGQYGIDSNILERIAQCESQFIPTIVSPNGQYVGLFQFSEKTWQTYRGPEHLNLDANPQLRTNPEEAIRTAAYVVSRRGTAPWPTCIEN
jgi:hypothetical protein